MPAAPRRVYHLQLIPKERDPIVRMQNSLHVSTRRILIRLRPPKGKLRVFIRIIT